MLFKSRDSRDKLFLAITAHFTFNAQTGLLRVRCYNTLI